MPKKWIVALSFILSALSLAACAGQSAPGESSGNTPAATAAPGQSPEPVTLLFYNTRTITNNEYETLIVQPIKEKYPHITLEKIERSEKLEDLIATNRIPDIIYDNVTSYYILKKYDLLYDLREYIDQYSFDVNRIKPVILETMNRYAADGEIVTLPFNANVPILYYNKDIFDKFNVPYPSDEPASWEELLEIARKLTKKDNGVQYIGLDAVSGPTRLKENLALPVIDAETGKAVVNTAEYAQVFDFIKKTFEVPGYIQGDTYAYGAPAFLNDRILAMRVAPLANMLGALEDLQKEGNAVNWDIAPVPNFPGVVGQGTEISVHSLYVTSESKHKEEAFQVVSHLLSDEAQRTLSRNGRVPSIVNPELEKEFGADVSTLQGKKIENIFKTEPLPVHKTHELESEVEELVDEALKEMALTGADVNTTLRNLEEKINKNIESLKNTKQ